MDYNYSSDKTEERGFISIKKLLTYVSEEDIFEWIFGYKPVEYEYVTSPFREDKSPGCWFEYYKGSLRFIDFANKRMVGNIRLVSFDCFNVVQVYYNLPNLFQTLKFIKQHLIDGKNLPKREVQEISKDKTTKKDVELYVRARNFDIRDKNYWSKYQISSQNLIEDRVFPITYIKMLNTKNGDVSFNTSDISYVYTDFLDRRKKVYRPKQKGSKRFVSNCKTDDIGNINQLKPYGNQLVITKSYKDCRVLRNQGLNSVWFQNEGMRPSPKNLINLCKRFEEVIVFYDNDEAGITASDKISKEINIMLPNKSRSLYLPVILQSEGISDPSDLIAEKGLDALTQFLIQNNIK